jgi:putative DNA methylase
MPHPVISPKKLIEVALPLDAINVAAAREKSIRHGHPSTLHLWWARRPLAAARAVIFGQLVHDPEDLWHCQNPGAEPNKQHRGHWTRERGRLFKIIEDVVLWENTTNETVLEAAREEIRRSWRETCELNEDHPEAATLFNVDKMPGLHDPFAGGGTIPLEAQRLGLEAYASDLNPVAVLINKAMIEIPPKFAGRPPVGPVTEAPQKSRKLAGNGFDRDGEWPGATGLAEDVRRYGKWMRDEAYRRIGSLYPTIEVTQEMVAERPDLEQYAGKKLTVIAWLWARTVKSPNPVFADVAVPLASTFVLSSKPGKQSYVEPLIENGSYRFTVGVGAPSAEAKEGTSSGKRRAFRCLMSGVPIGYEYIREEGKAGRMGQRLMAIVAEGHRGRVYLAPTVEHEATAAAAKPTWKPDCEMPKKHRNFQPPVYGMDNLGDLFTQRQLVALATFSDLVGEAREQVYRDAIVAGLRDDGVPIDADGSEAIGYAEAVSIYLAFALSRMTNYSSTLCVWSSHAKDELAKQVFMRQALPMTWDYAETNPFSSAGGTLDTNIAYLVKSMTSLPGRGFGNASQCDGTVVPMLNRFVATDPPYYDNIGYADLSDFFYVWLRRSLRNVFPGLLATIAVPKATELVATPYRHGSKQNAEAFFLDGMTLAMRNLAEQAHPAAPITIFYAFKQADTASEGTNSTGWETFLEAVLKSGLTLTGTWPMRTELTANLKNAVNALASSIVLVCRRRVQNAGTVDRRRFQRLLNESLPLALDAMTRESEGLHSPVAPVDLSQAIIGPGMAIFSRYDAVLEADGSSMTVKTALQLINRFLAEDDFDADTQFCLRWFEQHGWEEGAFGEADVLARAKGTSVEGVKQAGVVTSIGGKVRLMRWQELDADWDPAKDHRIPIWQVLHQLILAYSADGDAAAGRVYAATASKTEAARQLAYRLYTLCERRNWAEEARAYNDVVTGWSGIESAAARAPKGDRQGSLFATEENR